MGVALRCDEKVSEAAREKRPWRVAGKREDPRSEPLGVRGKRLRLPVLLPQALWVKKPHCALPEGSPAMAGCL